jgi:hypothetical protein
LLLRYGQKGFVTSTTHCQVLATDSLAVP